MNKNLLFLPPRPVPRLPLQMITVGRDTLRALQRSEVLVRTWPNAHIRAQYFRVMDRDAPLCLGPDGHFYEHDEYEMVCLERESTPFSRQALALEHEIATVDRQYIRGMPAAQAEAQQAAAERDDREKGGLRTASGGRDTGTTAVDAGPKWFGAMTRGEAALPLAVGRTASRNELGGWSNDRDSFGGVSAFMPPPVVAGAGGTMGRPRTGAQSQGF